MTQKEFEKEMEEEIKITEERINIHKEMLDKSERTYDPLEYGKLLDWYSEELRKNLEKSTAHYKHFK